MNCHLSSFQPVHGGHDSQIPIALQYRIGVVFSPYTLAILQLTATHTDTAVLHVNENLRNDVVNRILSRELAGIQMNRVKLVIGQGDGAKQYALEVDTHDYVRRNPSIKKERPARGRPLSHIEILTDTVYVGAVNFLTKVCDAIELPRVIFQQLANE
ncbi:hypothetical protein ACQUFY_28005 (plasmid) [Robbsia andropogonis]|uniref:hypothetical protein n=1 Tax=Robbsia andropogonis TaxID=28092 RepID=UPI003D19E8BF